MTRPDLHPHGRKAEVRKWMLYYDRQESFELAQHSKYALVHPWRQRSNRDMVRGLQRIEELLQEHAS